MRGAHLSVTVKMIRERERKSPGGDGQGKEPLPPSAHATCQVLGARYRDGEGKAQRMLGNHPAPPLAPQVLGNYKAWAGKDRLLPWS